MAVKEGGAWEIVHMDNRPPAQVHAIGIALPNAKEDGAGAPALVHDHQLFDAVPAGAQHVATTGLNHFCPYGPSHDVLSFRDFPSDTSLVPNALGVKLRLAATESRPCTPPPTAR